MRIPIGKVDTPDELLETAFHKARQSAGRSRGTLKGKGLTRLIKSRALEMTKIVVSSDILISKLKAIVDGFPSLEQLAPFYRELVNCTMDPDSYKKSLGAVDWAAGQIKKIAKLSRDKIKASRDLGNVTSTRAAFYGRAASVLKQVKKELAYLEECRRTIREFPSIKTDMPTVVIAGYPNVGKSTLLKALTGANPKIAPYPFTTKQLMFGYADKIQFIDTPGLLDKPFAKRNPVEKQAILALKHLATLIVFVIDPTEFCGYPLNSQIELLHQVQALFMMPMLIVMTKLDLAKPEQVSAAQKEAGQETADVDTTKRQSVEKLLATIGKTLRAAQKSS
jgi:nucleolar GTP-binding protein